MVQAGDGPCLAFEALAKLRILRQVTGKNFDGNCAVGRVSRAQYTSPIPPASSCEAISYGPR